jgi:large subunit ribosomal protein L24e
MNTLYNKLVNKNRKYSTISKENIIYIQIFRFCRSKCNKLFKKKRNPRKTRWTKASRRARGKELTTDATLAMETRRNEPIKYRRQLWTTTVDAVKTVTAIKSKRQNQHIKNTLKKGKAIKRLQEINRVRKHIHLIQSPAANMRPYEEEEETTTTKRKAIKQTQVMEADDD